MAFESVAVLLLGREQYKGKKKKKKVCYEVREQAYAANQPIDFLGIICKGKRQEDIEAAFDFSALLSCYYTMKIA